MINPSIHGWIDKFFSEQADVKLHTYVDEEDFYVKTRATGFIFGHIISFDSPSSISLNDRFPDEVPKIGLLNTLFQIYRLTKKDNDCGHFINAAVSFYNSLSPKGFNPLGKVLPSSPPSGKLEKIIHDRVQTNENLFSKNFSHVITNALLFVDVLAFQQYLQLGSLPERYMNQLEDTVLSVVALSLKTKTGISVHDELLQKLFESSVRYTKSSSKKTKTLHELDLSYLTTNLEKFYLIDLAGISLWSDEKVENEERYFLYKLGEKMEISERFVLNSIEFINHFIVTHKKDIPYFNAANPVKHFYDQTSESVVLLINRNKNRLLKELSESKELVHLIAKSTHKDLNSEEKKRIKAQLLDICKTIPSLTIFLLPGGSLLLPLLIKFIPKMLPSAFNENELK